MNKIELQKKYDEFKALGLKLDMSRGKPSPEQVSTVERLLTAVTKNEDCFSETGGDCRNYGGLDGIDEMKRLLGEMLGVTSDYIIVKKCIVYIIYFLGNFWNYLI